MKLFRVSLFALLCLNSVILSARANEEASCPAPDVTLESTALELEANFPESTRAGIEGYKSAAGIEKYMECWKKSDELHSAYVKKYKAKVLSASKVTGVPFAILACLFFRESRWNKNVKSPVGAVGIGQFMPKTWKAMVSRVQEKNPNFGNPYLSENLSEGISEKSSFYSAVKKATSFFKENRTKSGITGRQNLATLEKLLAPLAENPKFPNRADAKEYLTNVRTALEKIETREMYQKYVTANGAAPSELVATNADAAIILGAIYMKTKVLRGVFGSNLGTPSADQWVIATGAYNIGPAALDCSPSMTADQCIASTSVKETRDQMKSVRNCAENGNGEPMAGDTPRKCGV